MTRRALKRPGPVFNTEYQNYLVSEIEYRDGLSFKKGERVEVNGTDLTEIVLVSPDGSKFKLTVDNSGNLSTTTTI